MTTHLSRAAYVTFSVDDGFPADLKVLELLQRYRLKATFYVPAKNAERRLLSAQELKTLSQGAEIGAHTFHHVPLTSLSDEQIVCEVAGGKQWLEDTLGKHIDSFCYPRGKFNRRIVSIVRMLGFRTARTLQYQLTEFPADPLLWGLSSHACRHSTAITLRHALLERNYEGAYNFFRYCKGVTDWETQFALTLAHVAKNGGIAHLYLHSWEIEQNNEWAKLERTFHNAASYAELAPVTNGELFAHWQSLRARSSEDTERQLPASRATFITNIDPGHEQ